MIAIKTSLERYVIVRVGADDSVMMDEEQKGCRRRDERGEARVGVDKKEVEKGEGWGG